MGADTCVLRVPTRACGVSRRVSCRGTRGWWAWVCRWARPRTPSGQPRRSHAVTGPDRTGPQPTLDAGGAPHDVSATTRLRNGRPAAYALIWSRSSRRPRAEGRRRATHVGGDEDARAGPGPWPGGSGSGSVTSSAARRRPADVSRSSAPRVDDRTAGDVDEECTVGQGSEEGRIDETVVSGVRGTTTMTTSWSGSRAGSSSTPCTLGTRWSPARAWLATAVSRTSNGASRAATARPMARPSRSPAGRRERWKSSGIQRPSRCAMKSGKSRSAARPAPRPVRPSTRRVRRRRWRGARRAGAGAGRRHIRRSAAGPVPPVACAAGPGCGRRRPCRAGPRAGPRCRAAARPTCPTRRTRRPGWGPRRRSSPGRAARRQPCGPP